MSFRGDPQAPLARLCVAALVMSLVAWGCGGAKPAATGGTGGPALGGAASGTATAGGAGGTAGGGAGGSGRTGSGGASGGGGVGGSATSAPGAGGGVPGAGGRTGAGGLSTGGAMGRDDGGATVASGGRDGGATSRAGGATGQGGGGITSSGGTGGAALGGRTGAGGGTPGGTTMTGGTSATGGMTAAGGTSERGGASGTGGSGATFKNPLNNDHGSDPWMRHHEGNYYLVATSWSNTIDVRKSRTIAGLKTASPARVWTGDDPSRCCNIWAPELHLLEGPSGPRWYLYYVAGRSGSNYDYQRSHVLESAGTDPLGPYTYKGQLLDASLWAIDPSVLELDGKLYLLYSSWSGAYQCLYISAMTNPWTTTGPRVQIAKPTNPWEQQNGSNVNEGPEALQRGGRTFIVFSASGCNGPDYKLGLLALTGGNPLDAAAWTKSAGPVFQRNDAGGVFGPGHNGFFLSPDGTEHWIVYHAQDLVTGGCDNNRTSRAQRIDWNADGTPDFGVPLPLGTAIPVPSGE